MGKAEGEEEGGEVGLWDILVLLLLVVVYLGGEIERVFWGAEVSEGKRKESSVEERGEGAEGGQEAEEVRLEEEEEEEEGMEGRALKKLEKEEESGGKSQIQGIQ